MRSKIKVSAGGVVFKKNKNSLKILLICDPNSNWTFPKGIIEKNEDPLQCARREIKEEAGVNNLIFKNKLGEIKFFYTYKDALIKKTVHYFLFEIKGKNVPVAQKEEGIQDVAFFPLSKAKKIVGYQKTNAPIFEKIEKALKIN